ncbi:sensor histidine kinase N-terminal domain-containing protein [Pelagicoccus sp. NFK12]|uniref:histidine kinase n=1 Tax=Pelagicoccus enzymogenes TaxID=2773457 RepID=A0A927F8I5_9BACT|nr:ATP-binding protein [Pelagicoccus enzymogenes]MBD5779120.1 sensor histidine kinase N-terminal domain-containing protein [Pelagicoccus enzymogenes]
MNTIRAKLAIGLTLCFATLLALSGYAVYYSAEKGAYQRIEEKLQIDAYSIMSATYLKEDEKVELHFTVSLLRQFSVEVQSAYYQIWENGDTTIKKSESLRRKSLPKPAQVTREAVFWNFSLEEGRLCRAVAIRYGPKERGRDRYTKGKEESLVLVVAQNIEEERAALASLRNNLIGVTLLILIVTPILVTLVLRQGLSSLALLASKTGRIESHNLSQRFSVDSLPGELKPIATQLNQLLDRLSVSFERERTFSADVAHELRTPIAELRNIAEVGLKWKDPESAEDYQAAIEIATQMERIVNQLFELMRCESDQLVVSSKEIQLSEFIEGLRRRNAAEAASKGLSFDIRIPSKARVVSDLEMLQRVVGNLVDNAVAYSTPQSEIAIAYDPAEGSLQVSNRTTDLDASDTEHLFDRFWRKDKARADGSHSGIGLSIARAFSERLGLTLEAHFEEGGRITFVLSGFERVD